MYNKRNYTNYRYSNKYPLPYYTNQRQRSKKSGATYSMIKQGKYEGYPIVNAWYSNKNGLVTIKVTPYSDTKKVSSDRNDFYTMVAVIKHSNGFEKVRSCLYNITNKKIIISSENLLITPNGGGLTRSGKRVKGSVLQLK